MNPNATIHCAGFGAIAEHDLENTEANFAGWARDPNRKTVRCRECDKAYRQARKGAAPTREARKASRTAVRFEASDEMVPDGLAARSHQYIADPELVALWQSVTRGTLDEGDRPANILFLGPSGVGKTDGAAFLAAMVGLPFLKVDAASMTDPEAWFGTREVVVEDGASATRYVPSALVEALQRPGVVFIDEMNRVDDEHRNVWLPLLDGTGRVTNPLTGTVIERHPHCFIIMAGNRGLQFTGVSAIDPAFMTRSLVVELDYLAEDDETRVAIEATGVDPSTARCFAKFAGETRERAKVEPDFIPVSTREVIEASRRVARGLSRDLAAKFVILNAASSEGASASVRQELELIWNGVRAYEDPTGETGQAPAAPDGPEWVCPVHGTARIVPAGTSKAGRPYPAFRACPEYGCDHTEDRDKRVVAKGKPNACPSCGAPVPAGRNVLCPTCGAAI